VQFSIIVMFYKTDSVVLRYAENANVLLRVMWSVDGYQSVVDSCQSMVLRYADWLL